MKPHPSPSEPRPSRDVLIAQIQTEAVRAQWWIAYSTSPGNLARDAKQWNEAQTTYVPLSRDELIDDAFRTAERHIRIMTELADVLAGLDAPRPSE